MPAALRAIGEKLFANAPLTEAEQQALKEFYAGQDEAIDGAAGAGYDGEKGPLRSSYPDFYVPEEGKAIPATGYRYYGRMDPRLPYIAKTMEIPGDPLRPTYFTFDRFDTPRPDLLQTPHDASIRASFDMLPILENIEIPKGSYGKGELLEPITKDFPQFGPGGATQAVTPSPIELLELIDLLKGDNYHE